MKPLSILLCLLISTICTAQVTFAVRNLPEDTPKGSKIYISGNFDHWSGGQKAYQMQVINNIHYFTLPMTGEPILYKFTLGDWSSVEKDEKGLDIQNRSYQSTKKIDTVYITIKSWASKNVTNSKALNVQVYHSQFNMPQLGNQKRRIWMYLPPDYHSNSKHYPVIYMHDGQNLFDQSIAYSGEWKVDEILNDLFLEKKFACIVIGIDNGGKQRIDELTPWPNEKYGGGNGKAYVDFIVQTLKPDVDQNLRTLPQQENTAIIGSSLGGLISFYAALTYPKVFGKIGVFSPAFWINPEIESYAKNHGHITHQKMYFITGELEGETYINKMKQVINDIETAGYPKKNITSKVIKGGKHHESTWSADFKNAVEWLFNLK